MSGEEIHFFSALLFWIIYMYKVGDKVWVKAFKNKKDNSISNVVTLNDDAKFADSKDIRTLSFYNLSKDSDECIVSSYRGERCSFVFEQSDIQDYNISKEYVGTYGIWTKITNILGVAHYNRIVDGMYCLHCNEFCPMAEPNYGDKFLCYSHRTTLGWKYPPIIKDEQ